MARDALSTPNDHGTREIARQFRIIPKLSGPNTMTAKVMDETAIDRLLLREAILPRHHATLEGFLRRLNKAGFIGLKSPAYDSPIHADASAIGDRKANLIRSIVSIFTRLDDKIGSTKRRSLVDLCLSDVPWPGDDPSLLSAIASLEDVISGRRK